MRRHRPAGILLLVAVALWSVATPAAGHDALRSSSPQDGQTLAQVPASVVLTFAEPALALGTQVVVTGPDGPIQQGGPLLVDEAVTQPLRGDAPAGDYTVTWRVTSADGHPVSGSFTFTARAPGAAEQSVTDPASGPTPTSSTPQGSTGWIWALGGLLAAITAASGLRLRARSKAGSSTTGLS